jgi:hypothetical protein
MYLPVDDELSEDAPGGRPGRGNAYAILADLARRELLRPAPAAVAPLVGEIRRRHGDAVAAVVLYGSCLRTGDYAGGVVDFYVIVDRYRDVHRSRVAVAANAVLPPTVYYLEVPGESGTLRAKYAILSRQQFLTGARLDYFQSVVWARFCQPAILVYVRDADAVATIAQGAAESILTMVLLAGTLSSTDDGRASLRLDELWQRGLAATYGAELRVERPEIIQGLYADAPARYDRAARLAVQALVDRGALLEADVSHARIEMVIDPATRRTASRQWAIRRRIGKPLAGARLVKSMVTFGDASVTYALRKLERHTGIQLELTDRQRRWFWIACWPIIARLLLRRTLH